MKSVLVVDDERMMTELLTQYFSGLGYLVYAANNGKEAIGLLKRAPDIILLDINMPDMDGLTLCRRIRDSVACPIVFLTARVTEREMLEGLRVGGDDYITKPFSLAEIAARVEAHLRREERGRTAPELITSRDVILNLTARTLSCRGTEIPLSKREFDIVEFLMSNPGQVFDRERLYEAVWGYDAEGDSSVVKEHVRRIRAKLAEASSEEYIETIWGVGYKWAK